MTVITEAVAKALAQTLANESGHAHPFAGGYSNHQRKVTPEHERKARALAAVALGVVRDALNDPALREEVSAAVIGRCYANERRAVVDAALAVVAARLGGDQ